jgi:hypothetical protein
MLTTIKDGVAAPQLMIEECAALARACNEAASSDIHGNLPLYRALALAFHSMALTLAYQTSIDRKSEDRTQEFIKEILGPPALLASADGGPHSPPQCG